MVSPIDKYEEIDQLTSIARCPHDAENPYMMVSRALVRDEKISPNCRWLITYLLSNKDGWSINVRQVINHCKGHLGRDKVYELFNEAIEAGYMKRTEYLDYGRKRYKYWLSETPKFKKSLLCPENQYTEPQYTENQDAKERVSSKKEHIKEPLPLSPSHAFVVDPLKEWKKKMLNVGVEESDIEQTLEILAKTPQKTIYNVEKWLDKVLGSIVLKKAITTNPYSKNQQDPKEKVANIVDQKKEEWLREQEQFREAQRIRCELIEKNQALVKNLKDESEEYEIQRHMTGGVRLKNRGLTKYGEFVGFDDGNFKEKIKHLLIPANEQQPTTC